MTSETEPLHYAQVHQWVRAQEPVWFPEPIRRHIKAFDADACACEITGWCDRCGYHALQELERLDAGDRRELLDIVNRHIEYRND